MRTIRLWRVNVACAAVSFALLWLALPSPAHAANASQADAPRSAPLFLFDLFRQRVTLAADGTSVRDDEMRVRMRTQADVRAFAVLAFAFMRDSEVMEITRVRVTRADGSVVETPVADAQESAAATTSAAPMYSDVRELHLAVRGLAVGSVLEWSSRLRTLKTDAPGQFWLRFNLVPGTQIESGELLVDAPAGMHLTTASETLQPSTRVEGGRQSIRWNLQGVHWSADDAGTGEARADPVLVHLTTFPDWPSVGRWYAALQEPAVVPSPAVRAKALELVRGIEGDEARVRALYAFVSAQVHYVSIALGIGRYRPHAAPEVLENLYGDCKDKHTLLAAMLRAVGYDAWPALVGTRTPVQSRTPSPGQFDHLVTVVPLGEKRIWLDTTPGVAPFGLLGPEVRGGRALLMEPGRPAQLVDVPSALPFYPRDRFEITAGLDEQGTLTGHVRMESRSDGEVAMRMVFSMLPDTAWPGAVQTIVRRLGFAGEVSGVAVSSPADTRTPFSVGFDYRRTGFGAWEDKQIRAPLPPFGFEASDEAIAPDADIELGEPRELAYSSSIELPRGYTIRPRANVDIVEPFAEYHSRNALSGCRYTSLRVLQIRRKQVTVAEWPRLLELGHALYDEQYDLEELRAVSP